MQKCSTDSRLGGNLNTRFVLKDEEKWAEIADVVFELQLICCRPAKLIIRSIPCFSFTYFRQFTEGCTCCKLSVDKFG